MGPLPVGWKDCPKVAEDVINKKFFCFKTPLTMGFNDSLKSEECFTPDDVVQMAENSFNSKIGLWIDLTYTDKYYSGEEVLEKGIEYKKILCPGGGERVDRRVVDQFINVCNDFLRRSPDMLIGVHCTHGFNRTGFLVCCFLINCDNYTIHDAVAEFKRCRPTGIFRQSLVNQLFHLFHYNRQYGRPDDYPPIASPEPEWAIKKKVGQSNDLNT